MGSRNLRSLSSSSSASPRLAGSTPMPRFLRSAFVILKMSSFTWSPGSVFFLTPSRPAASTAENTRYGLADGSGARNSSLLRCA